uniref:Peptidyl-tRNA hydrolase n=1 Tax=Oryza punctata TaxID=4537 RepID=A0A0E0L5C6_ORYPU
MRRLLTGVPASSAFAASHTLTFRARLRFFARANPRSMAAAGPACCVPAAASSSASASAAAAAAAGDGGGGAQKPWLLVGLGNPGRMYMGTRHNVGFEMIDAIAEAEGISVSSKQFKSMVGKGLIGDVPVMLAKPQTYMNASGESVAQLVSYFKIPLSQVLVTHGHFRMRSIINHLKQSRDFPRLRIGIGRPTGKLDAIGFVLRSFTKEEQEELNFTINRSLQAVRIILLEGFNKGATFVNTPQPSEMLNK